MRYLLSLLSIAMLFGSQSVSAADIKSELDTCRSVESLARRLQCYDNLVDGLGASGLSTVIPDRVVTEKPRNAPSAPAVLMPANSNQSVQVASEVKVTNQVAPARQKTKVAGEDLFGKRENEVKEAVSRELEIASVDQISSEVTRVQLTSEQEYVVYLANGQVWRQKSKAGKWRIKVGEKAVISEATLGSYLMKSDARKKSVRAERLR